MKSGCGMYVASLSEKDKKSLIELKDKTAIKTHYPYYSGLEALYI